MRKKLLVFIVTVFCLLGITACGGLEAEEVGDNSKIEITDSTGQNEAIIELPDVEATPEPTAEPTPIPTPEPTATPEPAITEEQKEAIKETIIRDIARYNQYIYNHCGYPESEYGDGPHALEANPDLQFLCLYIGVMEYMDGLVDYAAGKVDEVFGSEMYKPLEEQIKEVRGTMFQGIPYVQSGESDRFPDYNFILKNFLEDGHPDIASVENISLEYVNEIMDFDNHQVGVIATFTCDGASYTCWLESTEGSDGGIYYTVLDLKRN